MKLPKYEGNHVAEANAQFAAMLKDAEALEAASQKRIVEIQVRGLGWGAHRRGGKLWAEHGGCSGCRLRSPLPAGGTRAGFRAAGQSGGAPCSGSGRGGQWQLTSTVLRNG